MDLAMLRLEDKGHTRGTVESRARLRKPLSIIAQSVELTSKLGGPAISVRNKPHAKLRSSVQTTLEDSRSARVGGVHRSIDVDSIRAVSRNRR
jgi:hypothetical protein